MFIKAGPCHQRTLGQPTRGKTMCPPTPPPNKTPQVVNVCYFCLPEPTPGKNEEPIRSASVTFGFPKSTPLLSKLLALLASLFWRDVWHWRPLIKRHVPLLGSFNTTCLRTFATCLVRVKSTLWGARKLRSCRWATLCSPCAAFVSVVTVAKVALRVSVFSERHCALTVSCGAITVPRRSFYT